LEITIKHQENDSKGAFFVEHDNTTVAELTYSKAGTDKFILDHTYVDEMLAGQKVGAKLVKAAVDYARENSFKILPLCPFANAEFRKHADYSDIKA
jgi:predicted GNAT family acetyltransferase